MKALRVLTFCAILVVVSGSIVLGSLLAAKLPAVATTSQSLKTAIERGEIITGPSRSELAKFIKTEIDEAGHDGFYYLPILGKALFWDEQVGSQIKDASGQVNVGTSCATCHFHAGADPRSKNQITPLATPVLYELKSQFDLNKLKVSEGEIAPNYQLAPGDFPLRKLQDPNDRTSQVLQDTDNYVSSAGVHHTVFINGTEQPAIPVKDPITGAANAAGTFNINGTLTRNVEPLNTPTVINAALNFRNFWNGRARDEFNGRNPLGVLPCLDSDPNNDPTLVIRDRGKFQPVSICRNKSLFPKNSSLASQADGPPQSIFEMNAEGKLFKDIAAQFVLKGRRLGSQSPLAFQRVSPNDSLLGPYAAQDRGLTWPSYYQLLRKTFKPEWLGDASRGLQMKPVGDSLVFDRATDGTVKTCQLNPASSLKAELRQGKNLCVNMMEANFSLFWGLAVQAYEQLLISDAAPFDSNQLTAAQQRGQSLFDGKAKCVNCHSGPEFTNASKRNVKKESLERMPMGNGQIAVYDNGFYNIAVRPTQENIAVGEMVFPNVPLSQSRLCQEKQKGTFGSQGDLIDDCRVNDKLGSGSSTISPMEPITADGAFKTPTLRNVDLTAPYFHNGGQLTLNQVVQFYNRGGDFGKGVTPVNNERDLDPDIQNLNLTPGEIDDLVAFLGSLTDPRVEYEKAPFDHPELRVPWGHRGNSTAVADRNLDQLADDDILVLPAVGREGGASIRSRNFLGSHAIVATPLPNPVLGGGYSVTDPGTCPAGTTFIPISGGYLCQ